MRKRLVFLSVLGLVGVTETDDAYSLRSGMFDVSSLGILSADSSQIRTWEMETRRMQGGRRNS